MLEIQRTNLRRITYFLMDETDRMLNMGFGPQIPTKYGTKEFYSICSHGVINTHNKTIIASKHTLEAHSSPNIKVLKVIFFVTGLVYHV